MKKRILFVDDEPRILDGLRRMLRPMHNEWEMLFAGSGKEALSLMAQEPFDIVVSDMRMPEMDGAALLTEVKKRYPQTVRFVLSGQSDRETIFRSVGPAHQFMSKPCDAEKIKQLVTKAYELRDLLTNSILSRLVSQMGALPSLPQLYVEVVKELQKPEPSVKNVGDIITQDLAMSLKILQLVNSAFFGLREHVSSPMQAVNLLGLDIIRSLVLVAHVFTQYDKLEVPDFDLQALWRHSLAVGNCSQAIAQAQRSDKVLTSDAVTAGFLHDTGKLVLAVNMPEEYTKAMQISREQKIGIWDAEKEVFRTTHAEIGAYLLGLWGLPNAIVEAVAFHHSPSRSATNQFHPLTAVHVADVAVYEKFPGDLPSGFEIRLDMEYLSEIGLEHCAANWQEVCQKILQEDKRDH